MKVFSAIFKRIHTALSHELKILKGINATYLNDNQYSEILDKQVTRADFQDDGRDYIPVTDPNVVTDMQKMGRAQFLTQFMNDPYFDPIFLNTDYH